MASDNTETLWLCFSHLSEQRAVNTNDHKLSHPGSKNSAFTTMGEKRSSGRNVAEDPYIPPIFSH